MFVCSQSFPSPFILSQPVGQTPTEGVHPPPPPAPPPPAPPGYKHLQLLWMHARGRAGFEGAFARFNGARKITSNLANQKGQSHNCIFIHILIFMVIFVSRILYLLFTSILLLREDDSECVGKYYRMITMLFYQSVSVTNGITKTAKDLEPP